MVAWVLCLLVILVVYAFMVWNNDYWEKKEVPFDSPSFFFGSFKDVAMGRKHFGLLYAEMYKRFKHLPYFGYFKLREPSLMINDPELIRAVLARDFAHFADNDFVVNPEVDLVWAENIFSQTGDKWKKNRGAWTFGMTASKLKSIYSKVHDRADIMVEHLRKHTSEPFEASKLSSRFFTDVIISSIVEMEVNSFEDENNDYRKILDSLLTPSYLDAITTLLLVMAPWFSRVINLRFLPKKLEDDLIILAKKVIENRKVRGYQKNNPFDSMIMYGRENTGITEVEAAGFLFGFLLDGTETSAGVLGYALHSLATNPDVQKKLRTEIEEASEKYDDGVIPYDDIQKLEYLDMVLSETLRLYPPSTAMLRVCTKQYELPPAYKGCSPVIVPVGMPITVPVYALHRDPKYFPDPERFDPERFAPERRADVPKFAYLPFGEGPRMCIGTKLAMTQLKVGIASILKNFEVRQAPNMIGKQLEVDPQTFILRNVGGLWITFHERI